MKILAAVISVSDTRNEENDLAGNALVELLRDLGAEVTEKKIVSDDLEHLRQTLYVMTERDDVNLIMTTGGTGFGPRDNTPEATRGVIEREAPGLAEAMRAQTLQKTPFAMLSRGICGIRGTTLIINLPGSVNAVKECFEVVRPVVGHAVDLISGNTKHE